MDNTQLSSWQTQLQELWKNPDSLEMKFVETPRARAVNKSITNSSACAGAGAGNTTSKFTFETPLHVDTSDRYSADDAIALDIARMGLQQQDTLNNSELSLFLDNLRKVTTPRSAGT